MSYGLISKCGTCKKANKCVDKSFIYGAIQGIHTVNEWDSVNNVQLEKGHLGGGNINIECSRHEPLE